MLSIIIQSLVKFCLMVFAKKITYLNLLPEGAVKGDDIISHIFEKATYQK